MMAREERSVNEGVGLTMAMGSVEIGAVGGENERKVRV